MASCFRKDFEVAEQRSSSLQAQVSQLSAELTGSNQKLHQLEEDEKKLRSEISDLTEQKDTVE